MAEHEEQNNPLYCFYVRDGRLVKETIKDYEIIHRQVMYESGSVSFRKNGQTINVSYTRLDRYMYGYVYTFKNMDSREALLIMHTAAKNRVDSLSYEFKAAQKDQIAIDTAIANEKLE